MQNNSLEYDHRFCWTYDELAMKAVSANDSTKWNEEWCIVMHRVRQRMPTAFHLIRQVMPTLLPSGEQHDISLYTL